MVGNLVMQTMRHVAEMLNREGIEWALAGGVALSFWDHARTTRDVDFLISVDAMLNAFQDAGMRTKRYPPIVVIDKQRFVQLMFKPEEVDFEIRADFLFAEQPFQRHAAARRRPATMPNWNVPVHVLSCEDTIVFKLVAEQMIDTADAAALLRANRDSIDFALLHEACSVATVGPELRQVWQQTFGDDTLPGGEK